jgi:hypothetical protein
MFRGPRFCSGTSCPPVIGRRLHADLNLAFVQKLLDQDSNLEQTG